MADIDTLRLLLGDRVKRAVNENVGEGDGVNYRFQFDMYPLATGAGSEGPTGHVTILLTGVTAATNTYVISGGVGALRFTDTNAPADGATLLVTYDYNALTSGELSDILSGHTGSPYLAAANGCLILAADTSRLFAYTMGDKSVDKRRTAQNLRELSKEYENRHYGLQKIDSYGTTVVTFDDSGTPYDSYDTAVATYLTGTG